jgi:hypothetical protein
LWISGDFDKRGRDKNVRTLKKQLGVKGQAENGGNGFCCMGL